MELVLIRHAEPEWVREGLRIVNPPLTTRGLEQAVHLAEAIDGEHFDEILVSPLDRARQTAAPLLTRLSRAEVIDPWLEEIRDPIWHGTPAEKAAEALRESRQRPAIGRWEGIMGGEPVRDFVARIRVGAAEFLRQRGVVRSEHPLPVWQIDEPGTRIAIVAHAGTNCVTICHLLGLDPTPWEWDRFVLGHASISRLEALPLGDGYTFSMTKLSDVEHLPRTHRTR
jgi:probable phosphoglycerate mutase